MFGLWGKEEEPPADEHTISKSMDEATAAIDLKTDALTQVKR